MSNERRSSASKRREARTDAYRHRVEKNRIKARNPWPDPFASKEHNRAKQADNPKTTVRSNDKNRQSRSKSNNQNKTRN